MARNLLECLFLRNGFPSSMRPLMGAHFGLVPRRFQYGESDYD
jgi:hypothetical protein